MTNTTAAQPLDLDKLLPCPFCGGAARFERTGNWHDLIVAHVDDCFLSGDAAEMSYLDSPGVRERMASKWNQRAARLDTTASATCAACEGKPAAQNNPCAVCGRAAQPVQTGVAVPKSNDGKEQDAFEAWASGEKYDMTTHPLHWLFLNERTYAARQGWKAALEYVGNVLAPVAAQQAAAKAPAAQAGCEHCEGGFIYNIEHTRCIQCLLCPASTPEASQQEEE